MDSPPPVGHVFFSGLNEPCAVDSLVEVVVNAQGATDVAPGTVDVFATSPNGLRKKCELVRRENSLTATFTPDRIGKWLIGILYQGTHIQGSPFTCKVFDPSLVNVYGLDVGMVGQELGFTVDTSRAGQGDVSVTVLWNSRSIPASVREEQLGSGIRRVRFTPQGAGQYKVLVTFNNQSVKGSPFLLDIADSSAVSVYGEQLRMAAVDRPAVFFVHAPGVQSVRRDISCTITGPSGKARVVRMVPVDSANTCRAEWTPIEAGEHLIDVLLCSRPAFEHPFVCQVGDPELVTVRRVPRQIEARNLHRPHTFEIDATAAGSGNLEIVINGGRVACRVRETSPRHFLAEFTPTQECGHTIEMRFNGEHVRDSPWAIPFVGPSLPGSPVMEQPQQREGEVVGMRRREQQPEEGEDIITELVGAGLSRAAVGEPAFFDIHSNQRLRAGSVVARMAEKVGGRVVEVRPSERGPGTVRCEYTLPRVAEYALEVFIEGRRLEPLVVSGFDARRVRVKLRDGGHAFRPGHMAQFTVDATEAGKGQLEISVNQGQVPNNVQMQDAGRCLVTFIPQHAGTYVIDVTFNGQQVHGCPIKVDVRERQVGKPVSAPVYARAATGVAYGAGVAGASPPSRSPADRGPSSAYFSSASPHVDTSSSYAPSPSSPPHPRSPPMVAGLPHHSPGELRSPALLKSAAQQQQQQHPKGLLGYTVAQYGKSATSTTTAQQEPVQAPHVSPPTSAVTSPTSAPKHKYFGGDETQRQQQQPYERRPPMMTEADVAQFEMTRSTEMTLLRERPSTSEGTDSEWPEQRTREHIVVKETKSHHIYDQVPSAAHLAEPRRAAADLHKSHDLPYAPLDQRARRTVEMLRSELEGGEEVAQQRAPPPQQQQQHTHIVDPLSSDIDSALTPGTRRRLLEHSVYKAADLRESSLPSPSDAEVTEGRSAATTDHEVESETHGSRPSSKATTPRLSLKFRGKDKTGGGAGGGADGPFDWGKSKISSKHEVVRRGKEIEVRVDGLKLGKEDMLRVVVMPPVQGRHAQPADQPAQQSPELLHKLRKNGSKSWEITFRPTEVGTHKVLLFVNNQPHPQTPFPIRVYDASQIVVGDIVPESTINDTVEFTVDAGRAGFGNLEMAIKDNEGIIIPSHVSQLEAGAAKFFVTFNPSSTGSHTVHITFNKEVVRGSPFEVNIVEPRTADGSPMPGKKKKDKKGKKEEKHSLNGTHSKSASREQQQRVVVSKLPSLSRVDSPVELTLTVPRSDDLVQAVVRDVDKEPVPVEVLQDAPNSNTRRVVFLPRRVGDHEVELRVGGTDVEGSPFTCRVYDPAKILVSQIPDGAVGVPVSFVVDASQAGVGNLEVAVNEGKIPSMAHGLGQHKYEITFVPKEAVDHQISIRFNNEPVPGSPFTCRLTPSDDHPPTPTAEPPPQQQPPSPRPMVSASGLGLERVPVGQQAEFVVDVLPAEEEELPAVEGLPKVQIMDPRGELLPVDVAAYEDEPSRSVVRYVPRSVGNHQISVKWNGKHIAGSPFTAKAFDGSCVKLAMDEKAQVGRSCTFTIDAAKAGAGNMEIIVSVGKRNVPNYVQAEGQARFRVAFTPQEAQEHVISVKFNGVPVPGSPMRCPVSLADARSPRALRTVETEAAPSSGQQKKGQDVEAEQQEELRLVGDLASAQLGVPKRFSIDAPPHSGRVDCNVVVVDPQGSPLPVRCYKQQDDSYWVEFTPEVCGAHNIEVTFGDQPLHGSPFRCEVVDPRRVHVKGLDRPCTLRTMTNFTVDRKSAGNGSLSAELADPQNEPLKMEKVKNSAGDDSFTFVPTKLGVHKLHLKLSGFAVPGSPFSLVVEEQRAPCVYGAALDYAVERTQQASLIFDPNQQTGGLKVEVHSPGGERTRTSTNHRLDDTTEITFRPQEVGQYEVEVHFNNKPVQGSPFRVSVVDSAKVVVDDASFRPDGMLQLTLNERNVLDIDATAAGPAKLRAEIRDSDGELLSGEQAAQVHSLGYGKFQLAMVPRRAGKYKVYLYCSELVVPSAYPLLAIAEPAKERPQTVDREKTVQNGGNELEKVILRGEGLTIARVKEPAEFIVDASELREMGKCSATLQGERADVPVKLSALRNHVYKGVYTPLVGGTYQLAVQIDGKHVPGSPSTVLVQSHSSPAELIEVDSRTLKLGIIGEDIRTVIDARKAGPGHLSAQCSGPTRAEHCELLDNRDGTYVLRVQPKELGRHSLGIKYEDEHVRGSPFSFNVSNPPDASKVKVYGPGIEHGILHSFKSDFVVETKGAGAGQLTVRVRGPKGAFNVEMQRDRDQDRTIHCKYEPREPGDYQVEVKWHGQHVPGSPFFVLIVDTEQELQRFLAGGAPSPTPPSPFVPPGWIPPGPPGILPPGAAPLPIMASPIPPPHFAPPRSGRLTPGGHPHQVVFRPPPPPQHQQQPIYTRHHY